MKKTALDHYLGREGNKRMNCAQAVLSASRKIYLVTDEDITGFRSFGGGNAPDNMCGAVFAAKHVMENTAPDTNNHATELLLTQFEAKAGSLKCKEIRSGKKLTCSGCVETAAGLLESLQNN